jgi:hypothetical protein
VSVWLVLLIVQLQAPIAPCSAETLMFDLGCFMCITFVSAGNNRGREDGGYLNLTWSMAHSEVRRPEGCCLTLTCIIVLCWEFWLQSWLCLCHTCCHLCVDLHLQQHNVLMRWCVRGRVELVFCVPCGMTTCCLAVVVFKQQAVLGTY